MTKKKRKTFALCINLNVSDKNINFFLLIVKKIWRHIYVPFVYINFVDTTYYLSFKNWNRKNIISKNLNDSCYNNLNIDWFLAISMIEKSMKYLFKSRLLITIAMSCNWMKTMNKRFAAHFYLIFIFIHYMQLESIVWGFSKNLLEYINYVLL